MGEVLEISMLSSDKGILNKLINFVYEYAGCSKDSIEIKVMDNWQYEGEVKLSDESQLYDLIDTKIIRIQGPCYLGFAGVTSEKIGNNYQFDVWMNPNPADEFDNAEFESFKKAAVILIESMRVLVAFIGKEMMIDYTNGIDRAVKSATGADIVIIPDKT